MLLDKLGKEILLFDGAMGTQLQKSGVKIGNVPETLNITNPELIQSIHSNYLNAGADIILTNTFGANRLKTADCKYSNEELIINAVKNAKIARKNSKRENDSYIALDIGPIGTMLEPIGTLSFDDAYEIIKEQILPVKDEVDLVLIETQNDLYELKAGILAVKENSNLPLFVSMTFDENERSLTGSDVITFVNVAQSLGVDALGVNCSLGPKEILGIVEKLLKYSSIPVIVQPNAGLPTIVDGQTIFNVTKEEFVEKMSEFFKSGVAVGGGCCGTSPEYIKSLKEVVLKQKNVFKRNIKRKTMISSSTNTVLFGDKVVICGERINPTGKKNLKEALLNKNYSEIVVEGIKQQEFGADILDVNVGVPKIDEENVLCEVVKELQEVISLPLQIDSTNYKAIEKACRYYNGRPIINSVNNKKSSMEKIFPIAKKYGAVVIGLTLSDDIPLTCDERFDIARNIIETAKSYDIPKENIIIDCLTLTASAQQKEVFETLKALRKIKDELDVHTTLGVSNISFGLPKRSLLNRTFLTLALGSGLDLPIIDPLDKDIAETIDAFNVLKGYDASSARYIEKYKNYVYSESISGNKNISFNIDSKNKNINQNFNNDIHTDINNDIHADINADTTFSSKFNLAEIIKHGLKEKVRNAVEFELQSKEPFDIIQNIIIPTLTDVGEKFEKGIFFLPQLIISAETTKKAFDILQTHIKNNTEGYTNIDNLKNSEIKNEFSKGTIALATVKGDVHDIGKNIVKVVIESYGYNVIDLGKNVEPEKIKEIFLEHRPDAIGLSALMTTTVLSMQETIEELKKIEGIAPILVGGAVLTDEISKQIGADYYCKDAMEAVKILEKL
ncbi:MAG: homocysteine S-methyltransferase family protein [Clostridioides sp.]|nr:homocysteine S-methyltransferase family protein [Clostridioides sp.]